MKNSTESNNSTNALQSNGKKSEVKVQNGKTNEEEEEKTVHNNLQKKKKNKNKQKEKHLLKKEARELRTKAMSEGLELFKFSSVDLPVNDTDMTEDSRHENSHNQSTNSKRNCEHVEEKRESKRRKKSINCA